MARRRVFAIALALMLLTGACAGGDDDADASGDGGDAPSGPKDFGSECEELDDSVDEEHGENAGAMAQMLACAEETPLQADDSLDPFVIGLENTQGDPALSFPDVTAGAEASIAFINESLGGFGGNPATGARGRPIQLETCFIGLDPADSARCANELAGQDPDIVIQGFNQNTAAAYPVLQEAGVLTLGSATSVADQRTEGVFSLTPGGVCVGTFPSMVDYSVNDLGARRVAAGIFDVPGGRLCYHDLHKKPLNILQGSFEGPDDVEGSVPDLEHTGVPVDAAAADLTVAATQIMDYDPDAILYSAPVPSCVGLVTALSSLGWSANDVATIFSSACFEERQIAELGDAADGIYFSIPTLISRPDLLEDPLLKAEAETYLAAMEEYQPDASPTATDGAAMFQSMMLLWQLAGSVAEESGAESLDADTMREALEGTVDHHMFAAAPTSCGEPPEPYISICSTHNTILRWNAADGDLELVDDDVDGSYIVAGTEIDPEVE